MLLSLFWSVSAEEIQPPLSVPKHVDRYLFASFGHRFNKFTFILKQTLSPSLFWQRLTKCVFVFVGLLLFSWCEATSVRESFSVDALLVPGLIVEKSESSVPLIFLYKRLHDDLKAAIHPYNLCVNGSSEEWWNYAFNFNVLYLFEKKEKFKCFVSELFLLDLKYNIKKYTSYIISLCNFDIVFY